MKKVKELFPCCPDVMNDTFSDTGKAFELAQGGSTVFELQEYLLLGGIVKQLEGATVSGACFCFYKHHDLIIRRAEA